MGIDPAPGADHAPGTEVDAAGTVENGKAADAEVGFHPGRGKGLGSNIELTVMDIAMGPANALFERGVQFFPALGCGFKFHGTPLLLEYA